MRVMVTGGAGFIGSHLVDRLVKDGYDVIILDDLSSGSKMNIKKHLESKKVKFVIGDVRDSKLLLKYLRGVEVVFHNAAIVSVSQSFKSPTKVNDVNVNGTLALLQACIANKVRRFIYSSSAAVYGNIPPPLREDSPTNPISPYGVTKLAAERYIQLYHESYGLETISLRYFNVYGPRQRVGHYSGVIMRFIQRLKDNKRPIIYGDGEQTRDFIYIDDVIDANMIALNTKAVGHVFNIATGIPTSINELAKQIGEILGKSDIKPMYFKPKVGDIKHSYGDVSKAQHILNFQAKIKLSQGLRKMLDR
ncbi:MAG: SDR family oxidoreductase [Nitrososphaerota archaeon]|nr:SDR family oxidoreductase [Nitrososphaerota archaeon]